MSILIKGMKMPKNCFDCPLFDDVYTDANGDDDYSCGLGVPLDYYQASWETEKDCPLVYVPPHGDLIDRNALMKGEGQYIISFGKEGIDIAEINRAPTIIPAEPEEEETK